MKRKTTRTCKVCSVEKKNEEFPKGKSTCIECFHLFRCYVCKDVFVKGEHRNLTRCNKCDNKIHQEMKKNKPRTEAYQAKLDRGVKSRRERRIPKPKITMTKEEARSIERIRCSVHKIFKRWLIQKKGKSFNYLPYTREEFLVVFPSIPDSHDIDHKIPLSWFNRETPIAVVYHLENLQLLPRLANMVKSNYWAHPVSQEYYDIAIPHIKPEYVNKLLIEEK